MRMFWMGVICGVSWTLIIFSLLVLLSARNGWRP